MKLTRVDSVNCNAISKGNCNRVCLCFADDFGYISVSFFSFFSNLGRRSVNLEWFEIYIFLFSSEAHKGESGWINMKSVKLIDRPLIKANIASKFSFDGAIKSFITIEIINNGRPLSSPTKYISDILLEAINIWRKVNFSGVIRTSLLPP